MRLMSIDYGAKRIGLAISDELQLTVRPLATINHSRRLRAQALSQIARLAAEHEVGRLVVGMPFNMDGTRGEAAERVERFIAELKLQTEIPIATLDERLTSREADELLREMGASERERRERSDEFAALIILQDYIDAQARNERTAARDT